MRAGTLAALALALGLAGCARCGKARPTAAPEQPMLKRSTDLRTAVLTAFPEFRYTVLREGGVVLRRTLAGDTSDFERAARAAFGLHAFREEPAGGPRALKATRDQFILEADWTDDAAELRLRLPLVQGDMEKLLSAPISLTTEQLALFFPVPKDLPVQSERFEVHLVWEAEDYRTAFLVWQLVDLATRSTWTLDAVPPGFEVARRPDGGPGAVPDQVSFELTEKTSEATLKVARDRTRVTADYLLRTLQPRPPSKLDTD